MKKKKQAVGGGPFVPSNAQSMTPATAVDLAFRRWCDAVGIQTPYISIVGAAARAPGEADAAAAAALASARDGLAPPAAPTSTTGRSVVAAAALRRGDLIAAVPDAAVLTVEASCIGPALRAAGLGNGSGAWREGVGLALALRAEAARGPSSAWGPYVAWLAAALPGLRATHPVLWPKRQRRALLAGTAIGRALGGRAGVATARHAPTALPAAERLAAAFVARHPAAFLPTPPALAFPDAYTLVSAYAFTLGADRIAALVPVWDALDHDPLSAAWVGGGGCGSLSHDAAAGVLRMRARRAVPPGGTVWNYYGDVGPARAVLRYGFAPPPAGSAPDRVEAGPGEVGVSAAVAAAGECGRGRCRPRINAAIAAAAAAAGGRAMWADGESGEPSDGLFAAAAAAAAVVDGGRRPRMSPAGGRRVLAALAARRVRALQRGAVRAAAVKDVPPGRAALAFAARDGELSAAVALGTWARAEGKRKKKRERS